MHRIFHAPVIRRRHPAAAPAVPAATPACLMRIMVATASVTPLRALVMAVCGDGLHFMRIEACQHGQRMHVWLSLSEPAARQVMEAVMRILPEAEFGPMLDAQSACGMPAARAGALQ